MQTASFRRAAALMEHPTEALEIPFEDGTLPGYFFRVYDHPRPRATGVARGGYGGPVGAVDCEKRRRVRRAAGSWLQAHPEAAALEIRFEVAAITDGRIERLDLAPDWAIPVRRRE